MWRAALGDALFVALYSACGIEMQPYDWQDTGAALKELTAEVRRFWRRRRLVRRFREVKALHAAYRQYCADAVRRGMAPPAWRDRFLIAHEASSTVNYEPHYTYHCSWACRVLADCKPAHHVDIGSSMQFVGMASAWVPITHYDYRKPDIALPGLQVGTADLLALPFADDSVPSLSCMHVLEHIGLGRYGDPIDSLGDRRAATELMRVVEPAGQLLVVVPVGRPKVAFNAHRIYAYQQVVDMFAGLRLVSFDLLTDRGAAAGLIGNATPELVDQQNWGCGCYLFAKERTSTSGSAVLC